MPCYVNDCEDKLKNKLLELEVGKRAILTNVLRFPSSFKSRPKSKVRFACRLRPLIIFFQLIGPYS